MPSFNGTVSLFLFFTTISFLRVIITTAADPTYLYHFCINSSNYTQNSTYQANLNFLLSSLSSSNTTKENGFYNATVGRNPPDIAYGLFLCRGDVTVDVCKECVTTASTKIVEQYCPRQREVIIWYDECMLRYSNRSMFGTVAEVPAVALVNSVNMTDQARFNELLGNTMSELASETVKNRSDGKKFATKEAVFTRLQTLYTLAQCTSDLSVSDCNRCLVGANAGLATGLQGARMLKPSCNVRYEMYPFYAVTATSSPAPAPSSTSVVPPVRPFPKTGGKEKFSTQKIIAIVVPIVVALLLFFTLCFCFLRREARKRHDAVIEENAGNDITNPESLQYDLSTIQAATRNFADENKIGEGGFGHVYKGLLSNGQEIAVKRLSRGSGQGAHEFKNEVLLVAKLQHRNLVRLLGFCLEGEEKILVYEFVPNKSLDYFLFDSEKQGQLDWSRRYKIIQGIARGILYLHEDSRLRIIHRDLKASNVLLDGGMNAKISDFGMARIFGVDQTQGNTSRIVGTYGYMSPEYAMQGQFSVKSDVYSFGVLLLEIISGKKNSSFYQSACAEDLLSYAWKLWRDGTPLELLDPTLKDSYSRNEVIRCIHIGLLCVQEDLDDRPTMASIVLMLTSFSISLQLPKQPAFFVRTRTGSDMPIKELESDPSTSKSIPWSVNEVSISELDPR